MGRTTGVGIRFLEHIPSFLIAKKSEAELSIRFTNGSLLQLIGSDSYDRVVGTNPNLCVFSEFALQNPTGWQYIRPILAENNGTAVFISTPRGRNHFYDVIQTSLKEDDWFGQVLTVNDTKAISDNSIEAERKSGMSDELIEQEFYCSFEMGQIGSIYGRNVKRMYEEGRIGVVNYDMDHLVYTAWDLGFSDATSIVFFQVDGERVRVIDHYENHGYQFNHYLNVLREKGYNYGTHFIPHDGKAETMASNSFYAKTHNSEFNFQVIPNKMSVMDGVELVRGQFFNYYFDEKKCGYLIKCLLEYHFEYDEKAHCFRNRPKHNWASDSADSIRYMAIAVKDLGNFGSGMTKENLDDLRRSCGIMI